MWTKITSQSLGQEFDKNGQVNENLISEEMTLPRLNEVPITSSICCMWMGVQNLPGSTRWVSRDLWLLCEHRSRDCT